MIFFCTPVLKSIKLKFKHLLYNLTATSNWKRLSSTQMVTPLTSCNGICLHIGCGTVDIQGWINIDGRAFDHTHYMSHDFDLNVFTDNSVSQIYMSHVLEHFSIIDSRHLIKHLRTKLAPGGCLLIAVPDFSKIASKYVDTGELSDVISALVGGQNYEYNLHKYVYDFKTLSDLLLSLGFSDIQLWDPLTTFGSNLRDSSLHPLSLNVIAYYNHHLNQ